MEKKMTGMIIGLVLVVMMVASAAFYMGYFGAKEGNGNGDGDGATTFDQAIVLVGRDAASGTRAAFWELVMNKEDFSPTMLDKNSNGAVHQTVSQTPGAVGYVGLGYLDNAVRGVKIRHNGVLVEPSVENVQDGSYPVARNLNLVTNGAPTGLAADFLAFAMSAEGQDLVAEEGFVPMPHGSYTAPSGLSGTLTITGSTTVLPVCATIAEAYMDIHTGVNVMVNGGGSGVGVQAAVDGTADIGMSSRELRQSEIDANPNLQVLIVAADGLAVIVHPSNPIANMGLSVAQVKDLYQAQWSNWNDLVVG